MHQRQGSRQGTKFSTLAASLEMNYGQQINSDLLKLPSTPSLTPFTLLLAGTLYISVRIIVTPFKKLDQ